MKETIAEYVRVLIVLVSFGVMCFFILGGAWLQNLGKSAEEMQNEIVQDRQSEVLEQLETRIPPTLVVVGNTYPVGTLIQLQDLIQMATAESADGLETIDMKGRVQISCDAPGFDEASKSLIPATPGVYTVKYTVVDDFGLKTTKIIGIVATKN